MFPFLFQKNALLPQEVKTYLQIGQCSRGIVYFEQTESYGGFNPRVKNGKTRIKIKVYDVFNRRYSKTFWVPIVDLDYAKKFNKEFGQTLDKMEKNEIEEWSVFQ